MDNYSDVYPKQKTMLFHFRAETSAVTLLTVTPIASTECFRADVQSGTRVDQRTRACLPALFNRSVRALVCTENLVTLALSASGRETLSNIYSIIVKLRSGQQYSCIYLVVKVYHRI